MTTSMLRATLGALLLAVASCSDITAPEQRATADLRLLHARYDYPALVTTEVSFYAVKGKTAGADLWYHARPGASDSSRFVEFRMGTGSLDRRPDGSAIAVGDSVLITLTATDAKHMMIQFLPSGLHFSPADQPSLRIFWTACGDDLNYDGQVDAYDDLVANQLAIWRQETVDQPWTQLATTVTKGTREVRTLLDGFSGYAISY